MVCGGERSRSACCCGRERARREAGDRGDGGGGSARPGGGGGPKGEEILFLFVNKISRFFTLIQIQILKMKKAFSQVVPKTKVVQNLILYNFHLGHFSKL
jgi:hypothetical protein